MTFFRSTKGCTNESYSSRLESILKKQDSEVKISERYNCYTSTYFCSFHGRESDIKVAVS